jgi:phosphatidyl-myo-inositol dimannoside synthase
VRYLLLTADFPPIEGGISTVTTELAAGLHQQGKLAAVGAPQVGAETYDDSLFPYSVFRIPGYHWGALRAIAARSTVFKWVREHRDEFDRIIALNSGFGGWLGKWLRKTENIPFDTLVYGFEFLRFKSHPLARPLLLSIYRHSERVLAISDFTAGAIGEFGVDKEKIHRIRLRVDTEKFHPGLNGRPLRERHKATDAKILLTVGRLIARKNHRLVLEALPKILEKFPETRYWIAGRGPEEEKLRQVCSSLGLEDNVRFLGYVPDEDLPGLFAACDLYIMPTLNLGGSVEGFGLVYLEAGACGKPSIASPSGGASEAVVDQVTGVHVSPERPEQIAAAVIDLFGHPQKLQSLGRQARKNAEAHSLDKMLSLF